MHNYNNNGYYGRPPNPPPQNSFRGDSYNRPPGPPPPGNGDGYRSTGGSDSYSRPPGPPPGGLGYGNLQYGYESSQNGYDRPPGPPPGGAHSHLQNHRSSNNSSSGGYPGAAGSASYGGSTYNRYEPQQPTSNLLQAQYQSAPLNYYINELPQNAQLFQQGVNFQFSYSNCTGNRKALLIGCNYSGTQNALNGCINDVHNVKNFIIRGYGYKEDDIVVLTDDQSAANRRPTKANILRAMQWLVKDARPNDSLFFHYSGHGGTTEDLDGDEDDGLDSTIYPTDFPTAGFIIDDVMHDIMVKPLPQGCRLTAIYDCCHSGTALDLPYMYSTKGILKEPNLLKDLGTGGLSVIEKYATGDINGTINSVVSLIDSAVSRKSKDQLERVKQIKASPADVISFSGCKDDQTSADSKINGSATGAMSYAFINVLSSQPQQSYKSLLNNIRDILQGKYSQKPQLSSSHPIDVNLRFIM